MDMDMSLEEFFGLQDDETDIDLSVYDAMLIIGGIKIWIDCINAGVLVNVPDLVYEKMVDLSGRVADAVGLEVEQTISPA